MTAWATTAFVVLAAATPGGAFASPLPAAEALPPNTVAVVADVNPRRGRLTRAEFQRVLVQAAVAAGLERAPRPGERAWEKLEQRAFGEMLDAVWIRGQATEMGIGLDPRGVSRELAGLIKQAFENRAEYHRFLKEARYTRRDVRERVELQLFSRAIQERILRGVHGDAEEADAFRKFIDAYEERWRSRTVCAPDYVTDRCSNGPPPSG